jgi:hypothetical protein
MPIYEMEVKYPPYVFWNDAIGTQAISEWDQSEAFKEFNKTLTSSRESSAVGHFPEEDPYAIEWVFGGTLSVDTDGTLNTTLSPESLLFNLADRLDAFLVGRFRITARSSKRFFGEITERERRRGEAIIVDVTVDELFGRA